MKMYQLYVAEMESKNLSALERIIKVDTVKHIQIPFFKIVKDAKDTFKPYKNITQICNDLYAQPFYGIGNIIRAALTFIVMPFVFFGGLIALPFQEKEKRKQFAINLLNVLGVMLTAAPLYLVRGLGQIASWPLTLLRMPLRGIITLVKGAPKIEDSKGLRTLVNQYEGADETTQQYILAVLTGKFCNALGQKIHEIKSDKAIPGRQKTNISKIEFKDAADTPGLITLFQTAFTQRDEEIAEAKQARRKRA